MSSKLIHKKWKLDQHKVDTLLLSALICKIFMFVKWRKFWEEPTTELSGHFLCKISPPTGKYHCKLQYLCLSVDHWKNSTVKEGRIVGSAVRLYRPGCPSCQLLSQLNWLIHKHLLAAAERNNFLKVQTKCDDGEERCKENKSVSQSGPTTERALTA